MQVLSLVSELDLTNTPDLGSSAEFPLWDTGKVSFLKTRWGTHSPGTTETQSQLCSGTPWLCLIPKPLEREFRQRMESHRKIVAASVEAWVSRQARNSQTARTTVSQADTL